MSTSWGLAEGKQRPQFVKTLSISFKQAAIRGTQIFASTGDHGARALSDIYQPEFPASDPHVTAVGGLKMVLNQDGGLASVSGWDEGIGSSGGGGISNIFRRPSWQRGFGDMLDIKNQPGRGVPDISTNAARATGYPVLVGGEDLVIGGTSAGSPLYAGMMLNINAELAGMGIKPITPLNPWMYARGTSVIFNDVTVGGNYGYSAGYGWDAVTGLGWVDGRAMLEAMKVNQTTNFGQAIPFFMPNSNLQNNRPADL